MTTRESGSRGRGKRAYILSTPDFIPIYVGERLGAMYYDDAIELSTLKRSSLGLTPAMLPQSMLPQEAKREWKDYRGTSKKTNIPGRGSKNNPYICDHCGYRTTRYSNMISHLEKVHNDFGTDPRVKSKTTNEGVVQILRDWKAF